MIERLRALWMMAAALPLAACASFSGMPEPVLEIRTATAIPDELRPSQAIAAMKTGDEQAKKLLRNRVIAVHMAAMDARYAQFRRALAKEVRGGNFGLEILTLGIGGVGTVWAKAAQEINAGTTFLTGSKGAINKEIYLQQTLPALVAMMDANRIKARTTILSHLGDSTIEYPLELAYADLANYELAASIDAAVQQLTSEAAKKVEAEQKVYESLVVSCDPDEATGALWKRINQGAYRLAGHSNSGPPRTYPGTAQPEKLAKVATAFTGTTFNPASTQAEADAQAVAINRAARSACKVDKLNALIEAGNAEAESEVL